MKYKLDFEFYTRIYTTMVIASLCKYAILGVLYDSPPIILTTQDLVNYAVFSIFFIFFGAYISGRNKSLNKGLL